MCLICAVDWGKRDLTLSEENGSLWSHCHFSKHASNKVDVHINLWNNNKKNYIYIFYYKWDELFSCKPCGLQFMFVFLLGRDDLWSLGSQSCLSERYGDNKIHVSRWLCEFIAIHCYIPTYVSLLYIKPHIKCINAVNNKKRDKY